MYTIGQRWASHTEPKLGLGIITQTDNRQVEISFPASNESRRYATATAPLTRINYLPGDQIIDMDDQTYTISSLSESEGLITYQVTDNDGQATQLSELDISCFIQFTSPKQRLFNGQIDSGKAFELRRKTLRLANKLQQLPVRGLMGNRTSLLPHQIYIAHEVAKRHAPRVLLADEVGLGKTIEAGMIMHYQLITGQISRVLILVPDSLMHQWLVEMLRRFNHHFAIFDKERIAAASDNSTVNPFYSEQLILCPMSLLTENDSIHQQALQSDWDMLIVDEAHHLHWSPESASESYTCVEHLAQKAKGVLLLTATPEQAGIEGHFARLRLLDPARFYDLKTFVEEENGYKALNELLEGLETDTLTNEQKQSLCHTLNVTSIDGIDNADLIQQLLDRHGTSRVLFRNTRNAIKGFPQRLPVGYALENTYAENTENSLDNVLYPEINDSSDEWLDTDSRVEWLVNFLRELKPAQALVICHHAKTAIQLDQYLNQSIGIRSACFHEGLSIIERDRAAAYFSDGSDEETQNQGAQVLICSEIGSEGRNFQFAHHLVLFDLPLNPDLLEQRIGRLDRIGQSEDINIHIPYLKSSPQSVLFQWYHQGLNLFEKSFSAAYSLYENHRNDLHLALTSKPSEENPSFSSLLKIVKEEKDTISIELQAGRDRLLERHSCNREVANALISQIESLENTSDLADYCESFFEYFGIESEYHSEDSLVLYISDKTKGHFPAIKDEGSTVTFSRNKALVREEMDFASWESALLLDTLDMILSGETGNTALSTLFLQGLPEGTILVECLFVIDIVADKKLQLERYLPLSPIRLLLDAKGNDFSKALPHDKLSLLCKNLKGNLALQVINQTRSLIESTTKTANQLATDRIDTIRKKASESLNDDLGKELRRLQHLKTINPNIREEEITFLQDKIHACKYHIDRATMKLDALHVIINHKI